MGVHRTKHGNCCRGGAFENESKIIDRDDSRQSSQCNYHLDMSCIKIHAYPKNHVNYIQMHAGFVYFLRLITTHKQLSGSARLQASIAPMFVLMARAQALGGGHIRDKCAFTYIPSIRRGS